MITMGECAEAPSSTSLTLLEGLKKGDPEAWRSLVYLYGPLVFHWCASAYLQTGDAEDIAQEVFLTVALKIRSFRRERTGDTFRGWLCKITRHKVGDWLRRRYRGPQVSGVDAWKELEKIAVPASCERSDEADREQLNELYDRALELIRAEFAETSWQAFWRVVVAGEMPADVAQDLHLSRNAVYVAKSRILRRLREVLGESTSH
jgi:RNA polymerase sigma-70 factor (ECF subfamily)